MSGSDEVGAIVAALGTGGAGRSAKCARRFRTADPEVAETGARSG